MTALHAGIAGFLALGLVGTAGMAAKAASVPPGLSISVFARVPAAREMAVCGARLYVGTKGSSVYSIPLSGGRAERLGESFAQPNGVACAGGRLYVASRNRIAAFPLDAEGRVAGPGATIRTGLPNGGVHSLRYIAVGPDGRLYVSFGSPCNICQPQGLAGTIVSMNRDGSGETRVAWGVRNSVGFDWGPGGTFYFTDNGADGMGDNIPPDELNEGASGAFYGFPYFGGRIRLKGFENASPPAAQTPPIFEFQAHVATLGIHFYRGTALPGYSGDAFIAEHGSWDRSVPVGYQVVRLRFSGGQPTGVMPFASGIGRPVDVKELSDGSLVISDDTGSRIFRVSAGR
jgi:glucose/arabinose dehydrogenase